MLPAFAPLIQIVTMHVLGSDDSLTSVELFEHRVYPFESPRPEKRNSRLFTLLPAALAVTGIEPGNVRVLALPISPSFGGQFGQGVVWIIPCEKVWVCGAPDPAPRRSTGSKFTVRIAKPRH